MYPHTHVHTYTYTHAHTHTHTHTRTHTLTHTPLYAYLSKRGDVEYSLRAIPLGGYVAFPDEKDPNNKYKSGRCLLDSWVAFMTNKSVLYDDVKHSKTAHRMTSAVCCLSACQRSFICPPSFLSCAYSHPTDDPDLLENRSIASRAAVISAGVIANVIFAYLTLLLQVKHVLVNHVLFHSTVC
jgi:membrane-associated protease RseP (regulator of RpoE activity)